MDKNGLPVANKKDHGIGLHSVFSIIERYSDSMVIQTVNQVFDVSIVIYTAD